MHNLLEKFLKRKGIENTSELTAEEKSTFDRWNKVLSDGEPTVEKIIEFCTSQKALIETQMGNLDNSDSKNVRLTLLHSVYRAILGAITGPRAERENLERYLNDLIEKS